MKNLLNALKTLAIARVPLNYKQRGLLMSLLPLLLPLFGCGGTFASGQPVPPGSPVPEALQGQWQTAIAGPNGLPDYLGGFINVPDAMETWGSTLSIAYYFFPDGRYQHVWMYTMKYLYTCVLLQQWSEEGTVAIAGPNFTFQPATATFSTIDSCAGTAYENPAQASPMTVTVTSVQDETGWPYLHFGYPDVELWLEKCQECE